MTKSGCFQSFHIISYLVLLRLMVQSFKLYNNKCMITSTQTTNTKIFALIVVLIFMLLIHKVLFANKGNRDC